MLLCGIRIPPPPPPPPPPSPSSPLLSLPLSLTLALWLTGISLVHYVCQWGLRLSCAPAYPRCLSLALSPARSLSHTHKHTDTFAGWVDGRSEQTVALSLSLAPIIIRCPVLLRCHFNGSVIFVPRTKAGHFVKHCYLPCSLFFPHSPSPPVRWRSRWKRQTASDGRSWREKDRSPTSNTSIRVSPRLRHLCTFPQLSSCLCSHHSVSPSFTQPPLIPLLLSLTLPAKINISACVCLFGTKMRVGSRALLESFISLTAKVGRKSERYDSEIWLSFSAHTFLLLTGLITYVSVRSKS